LDLGDRVAVEELTQLGVAKELAQLRVVEGQSLSPSLGPGLIVVVEKAADPREHQRRRKGRGRLALDLANADPAIGDLAEQLAQARQIKGVAQALAVGLEDDREIAIASRDREQIGGALALHP